MTEFNLQAPFKPAGGQAEAIKKLVVGESKFDRQTLLGITGVGKTFIVSEVIQQVGKPTLVLAHNKTLAAQLYSELKQFFPDNAVEYFVSYFDYYQPESYIPQRDLYIEKDSSINAQIEQMRLKATTALLTRKDVIIVSSISCIYGIGSPEHVEALALVLNTNEKITRIALIKKLVEAQYERNDMDLDFGKFRIRGDTIDVHLGSEKKVIRIELFDDAIESLSIVNPVDGRTMQRMDEFVLLPAKHHVVPEEVQKKAIQSILQELEERLPELDVVERQRLEQRTRYDMEMLEEVGYCTGIENYSRHFDGRKPGEAPSCLLDYFPKDFLLVIDESHATIPQSHGMYKGDYSRKKNLVDYGFRLPCAFDQRPLKFEEFEQYFNHVLFVSATPGDYELETSKQVVECIIRPTGLLDPSIEVRSSKGQIPDLINEVKTVVKHGNRVLVTTLTKRMAEDLTDYLGKEGIKVRYLHSDIETLERTELIRQLRLGEFDVLVGINLLREGIDIPEVELVAILNADSEGFLRNYRSLIQTTGRAARNADGHVIMYADKMTDSMKKAIAVTHDRRKRQELYNKRHGIIPKTIRKGIEEKKTDVKGVKHMAKADVQKKMIDLEAEMKMAAEELDFERAIALRDELNKIKDAL